MSHGPRESAGDNHGKTQALETTRPGPSHVAWSRLLNSLGLQRPLSFHEKTARRWNCPGLGQARLCCSLLSWALGGP